VVNPKARCCTVQSRGFCAQSPQWYLLTSCCFGWYTPHISFEDSVCQRDDLWEVGTWKAIRGFRCSGLRGRWLWVSSWYNQALSREVALCNLFSPLHTSRYQSFHLSYQCHPCIYFPFVFEVHGQDVFVLLVPMLTLWGIRVPECGL